MKYIWQNYSAENQFRIEAKPLSPYLEVGHVAEGKIFVNPCLRFYEIFAPLFAEENARDECLENCLLHYLALSDLKSGLHKVSFLEHNLDAQIRAGDFGSRARELYLTLDEDTQRAVLIFLQRHEAAQGLKNFFFDAVKNFFPSTKFYFNEPEKKFLICVPFDETQANLRLMELLIFLLQDMGVELEIFWNEHFGILGENETLRLGEFVMY